MRFQPGQSGNPGGRSKIVGTVKDLARQNCPKAIARLVALIDDEDARVAVAACKEILDRGLGKSVQSIEGQIDHRFVAELPMQTLTVDEWKRLAAPAP